MSSTYTYSLVIDFGGNLNPGQLHTEIETNGTIGPSLLRLDTTGDVLDIVFAASLSSEEQTTLDTLVSNHVPEYISRHQTNVQIKLSSTNSSSYNVMGNWIYDATQYQTLTRVKVLSSCDSSITYNIRIYDKTNGQVIATKEFSNTNEELNDMGTLVNIPTNEAIIEIQGKCNGGSRNKKLYLEIVTLHLD